MPEYVKPCGHSLRGASITRIGRAHLDPLDEVADDFVGQLALGRHLEGLLLERTNQHALVRFAGNDGGMRLEPC